MQHCNRVGSVRSRHRCFYMFGVSRSMRRLVLLAFRTRIDQTIIRRIKQTRGALIKKKRNTSSWPKAGFQGFRRDVSVLKNALLRVRIYSSTLSSNDYSLEPYVTNVVFRWLLRLKCSKIHARSALTEQRSSANAWTPTGGVTNAC